MSKEDLLQLLLSLEYLPVSPEDEMLCPICWNEESEGHGLDCKLEMAILELRNTVEVK